MAQLFSAVCFPAILGSWVYLGNSGLSSTLVDFWTSGTLSAKGGLRTTLMLRCIASTNCSLGPLQADQCGALLLVFYSGWVSLLDHTHKQISIVGSEPTWCGSSSESCSIALRQPHADAG